MLRDRAKFKQLLHEVPLYLLGRSLLVEHQSLYASLSRLAKTRNALAHTGDSDDESKYLDDTEEDALLALEWARQALTWFGVAPEYPLPNSDFLAFADGVLTGVITR